MSWWKETRTENKVVSENWRFESDINVSLWEGFFMRKTVISFPLICHKTYNFRENVFTNFCQEFKYLYYIILLCWTMWIVYKWKLFRAKYFTSYPNVIPKKSSMKPYICFLIVSLLLKYFSIILILKLLDYLWYLFKTFLYKVLLRLMQDYWTFK